MYFGWAKGSQTSRVLDFIPSDQMLDEAHNEIKIL